MPAVEQPSQTQQILNIAAYKFIQLERLEERRSELLSLCKSLQLRGTILLSSEGINLFLAGKPPAIQRFLSELRRDPAFEDLTTKDSYSDEQPFRRMLVRLKNEIIAFGIDGIDPEARTSPKLSARQLKRWLDEGRPLRLLDVRNDYEVDLGTFQGAEHLHIGHFREFPEAIARLPEQAKKEPVVMFCTGGIRCEKAGPLMEQAGFEQIYQLDGGILKYFEECGGQYYDGSCFVFDGRVALDPELQPTGNILCFACQAVLSPDDVQSEQFVFGQYCPHCFQDSRQRRQQQLLEKQRRIFEAASQQPGSTPYDNVFRIFVPRRYAGWKLIDFLDAWHPPTGRKQWLEWLELGRISSLGKIAVPDRIVREGERFDQHLPGTIEPRINPNIRLLYEDDLLVVVDKPAPLPVQPSGRFNRNTLLNLMSSCYPKQKLRAPHRLDANTSGVIVLCRTQHAARLVGAQFERSPSLNAESPKQVATGVHKVYVARVHGHPNWEQICCDAPISAEPGPGGRRSVGTCEGQAAVSDFRVTRRCPDGTSLVEAIPLTGRTNQLRAHLSHLGHAIVGDTLYTAEIVPTALASAGHTLPVDAPPMCLHAWKIELQHPTSGERVSFSAGRPDWARDS